MQKVLVKQTPKPGIIPEWYEKMISLIIDSLPLIVENPKQKTRIKIEIFTLLESTTLLILSNPSGNLIKLIPKLLHRHFKTNSIHFLLFLLLKEHTNDGSKLQILLMLKANLRNRDYIQNKLNFMVCIFIFFVFCTIIIA